MVRELHKRFAELESLYNTDGAGGMAEKLESLCDLVEKYRGVHAEALLCLSLTHVVTWAHVEVAIRRRHMQAQAGTTCGAAGGQAGMNRGWDLGTNRVHIK